MEEKRTNATLGGIINMSALTSNSGFHMTAVAAGNGANRLRV